ncbi:MAG TPA: methylaspartate mutase, partial [Pseudonocardiaceae bacterium]|nr:methylaspartate mutase [Pseudonocardiaceae bacterium]
MSGPAVDRAPASFGQFVRAASDAGALVVQPRMGMTAPAAMRAGLAATKAVDAVTVGTITVDSFTRVGDHTEVAAALARGVELNGYPIVDHDVATTRGVLSGVQDARFPVQVRHGSARPQRIVAALMAAGLTATEGGPISYCLPYGRLPLDESVRNWAQTCELFAALGETGRTPHLETFGGCLLGQLCPPSLLVAISVLEAVFFRQHGIRSMSLSYAQQTSAEQDREAIAALRTLAAELLPDCEWHVVVYAYMGVYPRSRAGAVELLREAARLAVRTGSERLIVKTTAESYRIPTIKENVSALTVAAAAAEATTPAGAPADTGLLAESRAIVDAVLELHPDVGRALVSAFRSGRLDVPYCLHPDNAGQARGYVADDGRLRWSSIGALPIRDAVGRL